MGEESSASSEDEIDSSTLNLALERGLASLTKPEGIKCCKICYDRQHQYNEKAWIKYLSNRRKKYTKNWGSHMKYAHEGRPAMKNIYRRRLLNLRSPALKRFSRASRRRAGAV